MIDVLASSSYMLRWINVGLAAAVVSLLSAGTYARWHSMPRRIRRIAPWVICTYAIIAYGSWELAVSPVQVPLGLRVGMLMIVMIGLNIALLYRIDDPDYSR